jgi:hypothetical protein
MCNLLRRLQRIPDGPILLTAMGISVSGVLVVLR